MDLVYLSENFAFESMKTSFYDRTSQNATSWQNTNAGAKKVINSGDTGSQESGNKAQHCKLCKEQNRKRLANYIRQKSYTEHKDSIVEEADDSC